VASRLDWKPVRFISDLNGKVEYLYSLLSELIDVFAPMQCTVHTFKVGRSNSLSGIKHWMDNDVEQAVAERNRAYDVWRGNMNRVKGDRRRRIAKNLLDAHRSTFVSINLNPDLPP
jgi:hypothetical protein